MNKETLEEAKKCENALNLISSMLFNIASFDKDVKYNFNYPISRLCYIQKNFKVDFEKFLRAQMEVYENKIKEL